VKVKELNISMNRLPVFLTALVVASVSHAEEPMARLPVITLPVRVHLVQSATMPDMHTTLVEADVRSIFVKVNKVWAKAAIQFEIESVGPTAATELTPEMRLNSETERIKSMIPKKRLSPEAIDICFIKEMMANGFYYGEPIIIKDTAKLKQVPDGLDEPLPRVTSHEIGHVLGLQHREDLSSLMHSGASGFLLSKEEIATARLKAQERLARRKAVKGDKP
jgi:Matrixin